MHATCLCFLNDFITFYVYSNYVNLCWSDCIVLTLLFFVRPLIVQQCNTFFAYFCQGWYTGRLDPGPSTYLKYVQHVYKISSNNKINYYFYSIIITDFCLVFRLVLLITWWASCHTFTLLWEVSTQLEHPLSYGKYPLSLNIHSPMGRIHSAWTSTLLWEVSTQLEHPLSYGKYPFSLNIHSPMGSIHSAWTSTLLWEVLNYMWLHKICWLDVQLYENLFTLSIHLYSMLCYFHFIQCHVVEVHPVAIGSVRLILMQYRKFKGVDTIMCLKYWVNSRYRYC